MYPPNTDWRVVAQGFDYDLWANRLWLAKLLEVSDVDVEFGIFKHMLSGQKIWAMRCAGTSPTEMPDVAPTEESLYVLHGEWKGLLSDHPEDPVVQYRRFNGDAHALRLSEIARHIVNHGTYHRGELRGLFRARCDDGFPETDFARFLAPQW